MSEQDQTKETRPKEVRRLRHLLLKMAELAEHVEQTGSFESGVQISVKRYNAVVRRLEETEALPASMFPLLDESADAGQLGAEATLLAEYLNDLAEESGEGGSSCDPPELGSLIALAPFLGSQELSQLVRARFALKGNEEESGAEPSASTQPDLKTIAELAPHLSSADVGELVRACLARNENVNPKYLARLAPHMNSKDLGKLLRTQMPGWFGTQSSPRPEVSPDLQEEMEEEN
jgi:hypothetical protein